MRTIIEEGLFQDQVIKLGGAEKLEKVLGPLIDSIARMPAAFFYAGKEKRVRIAFTKATGSRENSIPALRLFFIDKDLSTVNLLYVEIDPIQNG